MGRKSKETTVSVREIIIDLHKKGKSYGEIGQIVNRSRSTVQSIIKRYKTSGNIQNKPRTGRPKKLSDRDEHKILRIIKKDPMTSASAIAAELNESGNCDISARTIRRVLRNNGYKARVARKKPFISAVNRRKSLEFAKSYQNTTIETWEKVLFSDESKYNILQSDGRILVWRKSNMELEPKNIQATVKHGGGGVLVWGCMSAAGTGNLVFIENIMNHKGYIKILKENMKESAEKLNLGNDYFFQHDNDPKHTAYSVRQWIIFNAPHFLATPPQSPDLNPIEQVWAELGKRVKKHHIPSKMQLKQILLQEWQNISSAMTRELVHSMPRRLSAVIKAKGGPTKY